MLNLIFLYYNLLISYKGSIMKINNGKYKFEKRRKRVFVPIVYLLAEIILVWILLSLLNISFNVQSWSVISYMILFVAVGYSLYKTVIIYERQKRIDLSNNTLREYES